MVRFDEAVMMVRNLLQEQKYTELIELLPDAFFQLSNEQKRTIFKEIWHAINQGEKNTARLVEMAQQTINEWAKAEPVINFINPL